MLDNGLPIGVPLPVCICAISLDPCKCALTVNLLCFCISKKGDSNMKLILASVLALSLIIAPAASFAKKEKKGPQSEKAYENANENASFKKGDDSKFSAGRDPAQGGDFTLRRNNGKHVPRPRTYLFCQFTPHDDSRKVFLGSPV